MMEKRLKTQYKSRVLAITMVIAALILWPQSVVHAQSVVPSKPSVGTSLTPQPSMVPVDQYGWRGDCGAGVFDCSADEYAAAAVNQGTQSVQTSGGLRRSRFGGYCRNATAFTGNPTWGGSDPRRFFAIDQRDIWPSRTGCYNPEERFTFTLATAQRYLSNEDGKITNPYPLPGIDLTKGLNDAIGRPAAWIEAGGKFGGMHFGIPRDDVLVPSSECIQNAVMTSSERQFGSSKANFGCLTNDYADALNPLEQFCGRYVGRELTYQRYNYEFNVGKGCWARVNKPYADVLVGDHYMPLAMYPANPHTPDGAEAAYGGYSHQLGIAYDTETYGEYGYMGVRGDEEVMERNPADGVPAIQTTQNGGLFNKPASVNGAPAVARHGPVVPIYKGDTMFVPTQKQNGTRGFEKLTTAPWAFNPLNIYNYNIVPSGDQVRSIDNMGVKNKLQTCLKTYVEEYAHVADCGGVILSNAPQWVNSGHCQWVAYYNDRSNTTLTLGKNLHADHGLRSELYDYANFVAAGALPITQERGVCNKSPAGDHQDRFTSRNLETLDFSKRGCPEVGGPDYQSGLLGYFKNTCGTNAEVNGWKQGPQVGHEIINSFVKNITVAGQNIDISSLIGGNTAVRLTTDINNWKSFITPMFPLPQFGYQSGYLPDGQEFANPVNMKLKGSSGISPAWMLETGGAPLFPQMVEGWVPLGPLGGYALFPSVFPFGGGWPVWMDMPLGIIDFKNLGDSKFTGKQFVQAFTDKIKSVVSDHQPVQRTWIDYSFPSRDCGGPSAGYITVAKSLSKGQFAELGMPCAGGDAHCQVSEMLALDMKFLDFGADGSTKFNGDVAQTVIDGLKQIGGFPARLTTTPPRKPRLDYAFRYSPRSIPFLPGKPGFQPVTVRWCEFGTYVPYATGFSLVGMIKAPVLSHGVINNPIDKKIGGSDHFLRNKGAVLTYRVPERIRNGCNAFSQRGAWMFDGGAAGDSISMFLIGKKGRCQDWRGMFDRHHRDIKITSFRLPRFDYEFLRSFIECTGPIMDTPIDACPRAKGGVPNLADAKEWLKAGCMLENVERLAVLIYKAGELGVKIYNDIEKLQEDSKTAAQSVGDDQQTAEDGQQKGNWMQYAMTLLPSALEAWQIAKEIKTLLKVTVDEPFFVFLAKNNIDKGIKDIPLVVNKATGQPFINTGTFTTMVTTACQPGSIAKKAFDSMPGAAETNATWGAALIALGAGEAVLGNAVEAARLNTLGMDYIERVDDETMPLDWSQFLSIPSGANGQSDFKKLYPELAEGRHGFWCKCPPDNPATTMCREDYCTCEQHVLVAGRTIPIANVPVVPTVSTCTDYGPYRLWLQCYYQAMAKACPVLEREVSAGIPPQQVLEPRSGDPISAYGGVPSAGKDAIDAVQRTYKSSNICAPGVGGGEGDVIKAGQTSLNDILLPDQDNLRWGPGEPNILAYLPVRNESGGLGFKHPDLVFQSVTRDTGAPYMEIAVPMPVELLPSRVLFDYEKSRTQGPGNLTNSNDPMDSRVSGAGSLLEATPRIEDEAEATRIQKFFAMEAGLQAKAQNLMATSLSVGGGLMGQDTFDPCSPNFGAKLGTAGGCIKPEDVDRSDQDTYVMGSKLAQSNPGTYDDDAYEQDNRKRYRVAAKGGYGVYDGVVKDMPHNATPLEAGKNILLERYNLGVAAALDAYTYSDPSTIDQPHPKGQDAVVGPRGCDIGGWYEMMLYQARCIKEFGLSCICDYNKTFINGSAEMYAMQRKGLLIQANGELGTSVTSNPAAKAFARPFYQNIYLLPLMDRGIAGPNYAPYSLPNGNGAAKMIGLNNAQIGDIGIIDETISLPAFFDGSKVMTDARYRRHAFVVEKVDPSGEFIEVSEKNWGKFQDSCGNTDRWNIVDTRTIYRSPTISSGSSTTTLGPCDNPDLLKCWEPAWDQIKIYRSANEGADTKYPVCSKAELQAVYGNTGIPDRDSVLTFLNKFIGRCDPPRHCQGRTLTDCFNFTFNADAEKNDTRTGKSRTVDEQIAAQCSEKYVDPNYETDCVNQMKKQAAK